MSKDLVNKLRKMLNSPSIQHYFAGYVRAAGVVGVILILGSVGCVLFEDIHIRDFATSWRGQAESLELIPNSLVVVGGFLFKCMPYYLLLSMAFVSAFYVGARYLQDMYELDNVRLGVKYLAALLFAYDLPRLAIDEGALKISQGKTNLIDAIGGPGYLDVQSGNVVLVEGLDGTHRVCANGSSFVTRFERIKQVFRLDDRHGYIENMEATTKDGIRIRVKDIHYRYRLRTGRTYGDIVKQDVGEPYPFSYTAVLDMFMGKQYGRRECPHGMSLLKMLSGGL